MIDIILYIVFFVVGLFWGFGMCALLTANRRRLRIYPKASKASWDLVPPPPLRDEKYIEKWKNIRSIKP